MLELIAKTGLYFSSVSMIAPILLLGLFTKHRDIFARCSFLLLFTMVYNVLLKSIWQYPLPPPMEGWAFPSGHMHVAVVFWGWLAYEFHKIWFYEIVFFILALVGYGLIHDGYHYPIDVVGAIGFGTLSIAVTAFINRTRFFATHSQRLGFLFLLLATSVFILLPPEGRKPHVIKALEMLALFSLSWALVRMRQRKKNPFFS